MSELLPMICRFARKIDPRMDPPRSRHLLAWKVFAGTVLLYAIAPMIAGLFPNVDRRGPKIFWVEHHQLLCSLSHEFVYDRKSRPFLRQRAWFYGLKGKPDTRIEANKIARKFEENIDVNALLALRQAGWQDENGSVSTIISKSAWPQSFATNGVLEVRRERYGILVVVERGVDHEVGIFILENEFDKAAVENDPAYSRAGFSENTVYRYYRELKK